MLRQAEGGNSAETSEWVPINVRLDRVGGIFDQRNLESAAGHAELDDSVGKAVAVPGQNGGKVGHVES